MRVTIDEEACTGHGRCYALSPEVFQPREDDGHGELIDPSGEVPPELEDAARRASLNCPERAITIS